MSCFLPCPIPAQAWLYDSSWVTGRRMGLHHRCQHQNKILQPDEIPSLHSLFPAKDALQPDVGQGHPWWGRRCPSASESQCWYLAVSPSFSLHMLGEVLLLPYRAEVWKGTSGDSSSFPCFRPSQPSLLEPLASIVVPEHHSASISCLLGSSGSTGSGFLPRGSCQCSSCSTALDASSLGLFSPFWQPGDLALPVPGSSAQERVTALQHRTFQFALFGAMHISYAQLPSWQRPGNPASCRVLSLSFFVCLFVGC